MSNLINKAKQFLNNKIVDLVIGNTKGTNTRARVAFITNETDATNLIFDNTCVQNLMVYIHKNEIKKLNKIAIIANLATLRAYIQLYAEKQINNNKIIILHPENDGNVSEFTNYQEIEEYLSNNNDNFNTTIAERLDTILAMPNEKKWEFWIKEFSNCIKCYACRAACPLCYCSKCTVEDNQPQWIQPEPTNLGNLEWHILRAMHLAGRCISCGECSRACPVEIPLGLLSAHLNRDIYKIFGDKPGLKVDSKYTLSSFKNEDKEDFIK